MITPLHSTRVYAERQKRFLEAFEPNRELIVLFNSREKIRNHDATYPYRPDSSFIYISGFNEADAVLFLWREAAVAPLKEASHKQTSKSRASLVKTRSRLFTLPRDPEREHWDGERWGPERAKKITGVDEALPLAEFSQSLLDWLHNVVPKGVAPRIYSNVRFDYEHQKKLERVLENYHPRVRDGRLPIEYVADAALPIEKQRLVKEKCEIDLMQKAADINMEAHRRVMKAIRPGCFEYELEAVVEGTAISMGARHQAYQAICASGPNATILHYNTNHRKMNAGELFLIDAGCEFGYYASDITRTLPVSGKYNKEQRYWMDAVMEAHQAAVGAARVGNAFSQVHMAACESLAETLIKRKFVKGSKKEVMEKHLYRKYFTHGTSHWLGLDVHDPAPSIDENSLSRKLEPGMVFTVEPGIYFAPHDKSVPQECRGIGIRIEDDVVVTGGKARMLTQDLPRTATEIELFIKK